MRKMHNNRKNVVKNRKCAKNTKKEQKKEKLLPSLFSGLWTITIVMVVRLHKEKEGRLKEDHHQYVQM